MYDENDKKRNTKKSVLDLLAFSEAIAPGCLEAVMPVLRIKERASREVQNEMIDKAKEKRRRKAEKMRKQLEEKMNDKEEKIRPFHCGTQYIDWRSLNCDRCVLAIDEPEDLPFRCAIDEALSEAAIVDGLIPKDIADRMGFPGYGKCYNWDCPERQTVQSFSSDRCRLCGTKLEEPNLARPYCSDCKAEYQLDEARAAAEEGKERENDNDE